MNLPYLLASLGGVALVVALSALLFGVRRARIASAADVEVYLTKILPVFRGQTIALGADGRAGLARNEFDAGVYLVVAHGDGLVARKLTPALLRTVERRGDVLSLRLADFTLPRIALALGDQTVRWQGILSQAAAR